MLFIGIYSTMVISHDLIRNYWTRKKSTMHMYSRREAGSIPPSKHNAKSMLWSRRSDRYAMTPLLVRNHSCYCWSSDKLFFLAPRISNNFIDEIFFPDEEGDLLMPFNIKLSTIESLKLFLGHCRDKVNKNFLHPIYFFYFLKVGGI